MVKFARPLLGYKVDPYKHEIIKFPHFTTEESIVLKRFIEARVIEGEWWTDVKLPYKKVEWAEKIEEPWRTMIKHLYSKRIDAVCVAKNKVYIIEVKKHMLPSGIGQLMTYVELFREIYKPDAPIYPYYVTYYYDPDVDIICKRKGIYTWSIIK